MTDIPQWQFDEFRHSGVDYSDPAVAMKYDENHQRFRDYQKSAREIIDSIKLGPDTTVIDFGCGTGAFVLHAARICRKVYAVDVSAPMLQRLKEIFEDTHKEGIVRMEYDTQVYCARFS